MFLTNHAVFGFTAAALAGHQSERERVNKVCGAARALVGTSPDGATGSPFTAGLSLGVTSLL